MLFNIIHICYSYRIENAMEANIIKHLKKWIFDVQTNNICYKYTSKP